jgi:bifunctional non-homologous end joining protein LigD
MPVTIRPQLASVRAAAPTGDQWLHEIKFDGYRTIAHVEQGAVRLITRSGLDWTRYYGHLAKAFQGLRCRQAILDGEVAVQDATGVTSVPALEQALESRRTEQLIFYAFDLLHLDGDDLRPKPLLQRKAALATLLAAPKASARLHISEYVIGEGPAVFDQVCRMGLEGILCKRIDATYRSGRTSTWLKIKCYTAGTFVIVGFTESKAAGGLAALLLAEPAAGELRFAGKVGTGFSFREAEDLRTLLRSIASSESAMIVPHEIRRAQPTWVEPRLMARVRHSGRGSQGFLRHPVYRGVVPA